MLALAPGCVGLGWVGAGVAQLAKLDDLGSYQQQIAVRQAVRILDEPPGAVTGAEIAEVHLAISERQLRVNGREERVIGETDIGFPTTDGGFFPGQRMGADGRAGLVDDNEREARVHLGGCEDGSVERDLYFVLDRPRAARSAELRCGRERRPTLLARILLVAGAQPRPAGGAKQEPRRSGRLAAGADPAARGARHRRRKMAYPSHPRPVGNPPRSIPSRVYRSRRRSEFHRCFPDHNERRPSRVRNSPRTTQKIQSTPPKMGGQLAEN